MATAETLTTIQAIGAVYDWLGRPDKALLPPPVVCTKYWAMLGKIQGKVNISDRTHYLNKREFTVPVNTFEYVLSEIPDFGSEIGLEIVDRAQIPETSTPVPLIADVRKRDSVVELSAFLYRDAGAENGLTLRFSRAVPATWNFRLWYEPGTFARPGKNESPVIPQQALNYVMIETAFACLPDISKIYEPNVYRAYADNVAVQKAEFGKDFQTWLNKDKGAGVNHRKAFNERRRGQGRYGGGYGGGSGGPRIGEV